MCGGCEGRGSKGSDPGRKGGGGGERPSHGRPGRGPLLSSHPGAWLFKLKARAASHRGLQLAESGEALGFPGPITAFARPLTPAAQGEQPFWGVGASVGAGLGG